MMGPMRPPLVAITMALLALIATGCSDSATVRAEDSPAASDEGSEIRAYLALCSARDAASIASSSGRDPLRSGCAPAALSIPSRQVDGLR